MDKFTAVFGGTFNPIHNGHVAMVKTVMKLPYVEKLIIIPTCIPPHKSASSLASGDDRINMCRIALEKLKRVEVSDIELTRGGSSYTYDTLCALKENGINQPALVCGGDMITTFDSWYRAEDILKMAQLIAFRRVGIDGDAFDAAIDRLSAKGAKIEVIDTDIPNISSSDVRAGRFDLIPPDVLDYIRKNGLYGE